MLELEYGIVSRFDDRPGMRFGSLMVLGADGKPTGEELWLHANDGQWVEIEDDDIKFIGRVYPNGYVMVVPMIGLKLAFQRSPGKDDRPKASPWTLAEAYNNRVCELNAPHYRVVEVKNGDESVFWEGKGSEELSRE